MTIDDLRIFYNAKSDYALAALLGVSKGMVSKWRSKGIPEGRQAMIQIQTDGKLKANLPKVA